MLVLTGSAVGPIAVTIVPPPRPRPGATSSEGRDRAMRRLQQRLQRREVTSASLSGPAHNLWQGMQRGLKPMSQPKRSDRQLGNTVEERPISIEVGKPPLTRTTAVHLVSRQGLRTPPHLGIPAHQGSSFMMTPWTHLHACNASPGDVSMRESDFSGCEASPPAQGTSSRSTATRGRGCAMAAAFKFFSRENPGLAGRSPAWQQIPARLITSVR